jgi:hypothetical protein
VGFHLQQGLKNQVARILSRAGDINRMVAERRVSAEEL